jgi:hypothetical protein
MKPVSIFCSIKMKRASIFFSIRKYEKWDRGHGSSGRAPAKQMRGLGFKHQYYKK